MLRADLTSKQSRVVGRGLSFDCVHGFVLSSIFHKSGVLRPDSWFGSPVLYLRQSDFPLQCFL